MRDVTILSCSFISGGGGGVRADGLAQRVRIVNNTFRYLGHEAAGLYGLGLGVTQLTDDNAIEFNDVSATAMVKFDAPALVLEQPTPQCVLTMCMIPLLSSTSVAHATAPGSQALRRMVAS